MMKSKKDVSNKSQTTNTSTSNDSFFSVDSIDYNDYNHVSISKANESNIDLTIDKIIDSKEKIDYFDINNKIIEYNHKSIDMVLSELFTYMTHTKNESFSYKKVIYYKGMSYIQKAYTIQELKPSHIMKMLNILIKLNDRSLLEEYTKLVDLNYTGYISSSYIDLYVSYILEIMNQSNENQCFKRIFDIFNKKIHKNILHIESHMKIFEFLLNESFFYSSYKNLNNESKDFLNEIYNNGININHYSNNNSCFCGEKKSLLTFQYISLLKKCGNNEKIIEIYDSLLSNDNDNNNCLLDIHSVNSLLDMFIESGKSIKAFGLLSRLEFDLSLKSTIHFISSSSKNITERLSFLPDIRIYCHLLTLFSKTSKINEAIEVYNYIINMTGTHTKVISLSTFHIFLDCLARHKEEKYCLELFNQIRNNHEVSLSIYGIMMKLYSNLKNKSMMLYYYNQALTNHLKPNIIIYQIIIKFYISNEEYIEAEEVFKEMMLNDINPDIQMWELLIKSLVDKGKIQICFNFYIKSLFYYKSIEKKGVFEEKLGKIKGKIDKSSNDSVYYSQEMTSLFEFFFNILRKELINSLISREVKTCYLLEMILISKLNPSIRLNQKLNQDIVKIVSDAYNEFSLVSNTNSSCSYNQRKGKGKVFIEHEQIVFDFANIDFEYSVKNRILSKGLYFSCSKNEKIKNEDKNYNQYSQYPNQLINEYNESQYNQSQYETKRNTNTNKHTNPNQNKYKPSHIEKNEFSNPNTSLYDMSKPKVNQKEGKALNKEKENMNMKNINKKEKEKIGVNLKGNYQITNKNYMKKSIYDM